MSKLTRIYKIEKTDGTNKNQVNDAITVEEPLEIQVSSLTSFGAAAKSISITMRTPGNDLELALGFLYTEGIITCAEDIISIKHVGQPIDKNSSSNIIRVEMKENINLDLQKLERHFYTTSSCGVCGKSSLDALKLSGYEKIKINDVFIKPKTLLRLSEDIKLKQPVFLQTGGLHAAALFSSDGEIMIVREDIGRHNATDKVIGALLREKNKNSNNFGLFVSGRASFELMQKTLVAKIPLLAAVGAPSSLAVDMAKEFGITLIGFLRNGDFNIYSGSKRIK